MVLFLFFPLSFSASISQCNFVSLSLRPIDYISSSENLHLSHCSFNNITSPSGNGGALRFTSQTYNFTIIFTCYSFCCSATGFGMTSASDTKGFHQANSCSIQYSSYQNNMGYHAGIYFIRGYQIVKDINTSNNYISAYAGIGFESSSSLQYSYSTISKNIAKDWAALCYRYSGIYKSDYINCVNNSQLSSSWAIVSVAEGNSVMSKCVFLFNGIIGSKKLFRSTGSLTIQDSSIQTDCSNEGATISNCNTLNVQVPLDHFKSRVCGYDEYYTHDTKNRYNRLMFLLGLVIF